MKRTSMDTDNFKIFAGVQESFFVRLQEENASGLDDVEGRLFFHDMELSFVWEAHTRNLVLKLVDLPSTFSGDVERAWELITSFIAACGGVEKATVENAP